MQQDKYIYLKDSPTVDELNSFPNFFAVQKREKNQEQKS
jgi:hypothetical protein